MRLTDRDQELLAYVAEHRLVMAAHVQELLGVSAPAAYARLRSLSSAGMLSQRTVFHNQPGCYQITRKGLAVSGSQLPAPQLDLNCYEHDVGVAWLWLAARNGTFGPQREVISERRLRSHDASPDGRREPYAVRLGGVGPGGRPRLHYPDLLLVDPGGHRVAIELELTPKGRTRREKILAGYGADRDIAAVLYLTDRPSVARSVSASAAALGISDRVQVQNVHRPVPAAARSAGRAPERRPRAREHAAPPPAREAAR